MRRGGQGFPDILVKTGAGSYVVENPSAMATNVHVKAGTLAFSAEGYACTLYRWNVTAWNN